MSAMSFREPNQVLWRGVRPGHKGTQIIGSNDAENTTVDILQVTAGKKGYITEITTSARASATGTVWVYWTDSANAIQKTLFKGVIIINLQLVIIPIKYWPPLEIGNNHKIRIRSAIENLFISSTAKGWEE